jgi:serine/threonine-protein kinase
MVDAKVANSVIVSQIRSSKTDFNLSSGEVIRLTKAGVPAIVIEAMRNPKAAPPPATPGQTKTASTPSRTPSTPPTSTTATPPPATSAATPPPASAPSAATPAPSPAPATRPAPEKLVVVTVNDGQPIPINLAADIPADAEEGAPLRFVAAADFRAGDTVVIAKGASVTGVIVESAGKKKFLGMGGGKMTFRLMQVDAVDGHKLNVRATPGRRSDGPAVRPVDTGSQKRTKEVAAAAGTQYIAYIEGEQTVSIQK